MVAPTNDDRRQAEDALSFIRRTMESATNYTTLSGWGVACVGVIGLIAAWIDSGSPEIAPLRVWTPAAVAGLAVTAMAMAWKAKRQDTPVWSSAVRKIAWGLLPALVAGSFLTLALSPVAKSLVPGTWLVLYGAGVVAGSIFSVHAIRYMGITMLALGGIALFNPAWGPILLAAGFGGVHVVSGLYIVMKHGG